MARLSILGLGNWGTALAKVWLQAGHEVRAWTIEEDVAESILATGVNRKYLEGVELGGLEVSTELAEIAPSAEILALALPSSVVLGVVDDLLGLLRADQVLLDLAKGLAPGDQLVSQAIAARLGKAGLANPLAVLTGPTIAPEVARGVLTTALIASHDRPLASDLARRLTTPTLVLQAAGDPAGAELWGAFKNVIALACGVVDGLKTRGGLAGDNLKAAIFGAGFEAGCRLLPRLGAEPETALTPAGIGDLYVTASSPHGRNRHLGEQLGLGRSLDEAQGEMVMVSEGVRAARMFAERAEAAGLELPFLNAVSRLLDGSVEPENFARQLLAGE
ncbi:MAG: NAD(P)H-dependent glycerol-3-phosphate dehydrogenase [Proteobacteria bacterium]|nr:NAD(P)H-dependent glycerol-3-phosphate dehydrogenase [Pseudomonadota bacterium]